MATFACCSACVSKESSCDVAWSLGCLRCSRANAAARQSWSLLRVGDEPEKGLARKQLRWMVNDKLWASEPHPAEGCLLSVPPMSMIWYTWGFSILSERNYRNIFQLTHWKTFKANTTFSIDYFSSQGLAHSHHSMRVGEKVTALFSGNYGFLQVRSTMVKAYFNNNNREIVIVFRHQTRRWTHRLD